MDTTREAGRSTVHGWVLATLLAGLVVFVAGCGSEAPSTPAKSPGNGSERPAAAGDDEPAVEVVPEDEAAYGGVAGRPALLPPPTSPPQPPADPDGYRVLFIGNSLTYVNDLPATIAALAAAAKEPKPFTFVREAVSGAPLKQHWQQGKAVALIRQGGWNYVVVQDHSTAPLLMAEEMKTYVPLFVKEIRAVGAKPLLYQTWARVDAPETQDAISGAYDALGKADDVVVVPAGEAWRANFARPSPFVLHQRDGKHPLAAGTYLTACVFYATLYHHSPVGLPAVMKGKALSAEQAKALQELAVATVIGRGFPVESAGAPAPAPR